MRMCFKMLILDLSPTLLFDLMLECAPGVVCLVKSVNTHAERENDYAVTPLMLRIL